MDYAKKAVRSSITIFLFSIISIILGFFLRAFLARSLSVSEFGLLYSVIAFIGLFSLFRDLGLNPALIKYIPEFIVEKNKSKVKSSFIFTFIVQFSIAILAMIPVFLFSNFLSQYFFKTQLSIPVLHFFALTFIASVLFHLIQAFFQGLQNMKFYAILEPTRLVFVFIISAVFIALGMGVRGVSIGYFLGILFSGLLGFLFSLKIFPFFSTKTKINEKLIKNLFAFAFPVILAGIVGVLIGYTDTLLLTFFKTLEDVGYYQVASPISEVAGLVVGAMSIVAFPMISELWVHKKKNIISNGISLIIKASLIVLIPTASVVISSPDLIISILFTDKYLPAVTALQILTIAVIFQSLTIILFSLLKGIGKPMLATKSVAVLAIIDLIANLLLIPPLGIVGAAIATTIAFFIAFLVTIVMAKRHIHIRFPYIPAAKIVFSGLVMILFITIARPFAPDDNLSKFIITSSLGIILYAFLVSALGAVKRNDIRVLTKIIYIPNWIIKFFRE